ncbi:MULTISPECIES: hypothetical protein [unclassified Sphingobium]|uniref:hypothetical protein n=1 Tax=unclassified Sphingobium TaxID=2611147 RepID=UPI0035A578E3
MISRFYPSFSGAFLGLVIMQGCAQPAKINAGRSSEIVVEKKGIFFSGEYSVFKSSDGDVFVLRTRDEKQSVLFSRLAPMAIDAEDVCLYLTIRGKIGGELDYNGRKIFDVGKVKKARKIECHWEML